ncbi:hypothetical protein HPG69_014019 [Diceros bicornis minor]|uniref:Immunoglobulin V-set domain-containing protein n=1 Tax=Diceros bicornis minor TaxID=77932 RepID=A0A7J7EMR9_DICBM|nr:hypothetical protein HPG69_014019 [Diceros bicornis minor]
MGWAGPGLLLTLFPHRVQGSGWEILAASTGVCDINYSNRYPAHGYWFQEGTYPHQDAPVATNNPNVKVQDETKGRFHLLGNPQIYDCSLDIRDARRRDSGTYFFRVERGPFMRYNYRKNRLFVHVMALTQTPDIHIQGTLESGQPKNITCAVPWALLTLTPRPQDHSTYLTCRVSFPGAGVSTEKTVQLNVSCECQASEAGYLRAVGVGGWGDRGSGILGTGSCKLDLGGRKDYTQLHTRPVSKVLGEKGQCSPSCH